MQIDSNITTRSHTGTAAMLTPELEQLVMELKAQLGQKLEAVVARVTLLTDAERQQLLAARATDKPVAGQRTLMAVLQDPDVKLAELTIRDRTVATLTNLPLTQNAKVLVLVTPRGLLVLPPPVPPAVAPVPNPPPAGLPLVQNAPAAPPQAVLPAGLATPPTSQFVPETARTPPVLTTGAVAPPKSASAGGSPPAQPTLRPAPSGQAPTTAAAAGVSATPPPTKTALALAAEDIASRKALLAAAVSQALPVAQPLKALLRSMAFINDVIARSPQVPVPAPLVQLSEKLSRIASLGVDPTIPKPESIRQAMNASGLFYERRLLAEPAAQVARETPPLPLAERDIKGLLILLSQWAAAQTFAPAPAPGAQSTSDPLAQLMMNLARLLSPRQEQPKDPPSSRQLSRAVHEMAERSLAQIQLQQYRTLSSQLQDPNAPAQWHLDIPLKLPDGQGNLYMQLFEPRLASDEKAEGKKKKVKKEGKGRWRVFLELELDQLGALAAEIAVQEKTVEATLWTDNNSLRQRANAHLAHLRQDLEQQGMVVVDLRCSESPPPDQKIRLDYALIDVKT